MSRFIAADSGYLNLDHAISIDRSIGPDEPSPIAPADVVVRWIAFMTVGKPKEFSASREQLERVLWPERRLAEMEATP